MHKLTRNDLHKLREQKRREGCRREGAVSAARIRIGMGTCGIAAGAQAALDALTDELSKLSLTDVTVQPTGCMGLCYSEPTVEVLQPGMPAVIYGRVDADVARRIVTEHLVKGRLLNDHIYDHPAADLGPLAPSAAPPSAAKK